MSPSCKRWSVSRLSLALILTLGTLTARAEHFRITLTVRQGEETAEAHGDDTPPVGGLYPRPVFHGRAGKPLTFQFIMTDIYPHHPIKGVTVHYFVVKEKVLAQKELPPLDENVVLQGTFHLDFKPDGRVGLRQQFRIPAPGTYLLRVQSENSQSGHEHFSAIDLQIDSP